MVAEVGMGLGGGTPRRNRQTALDQGIDVSGGSGNDVGQETDGSCQGEDGWRLPSRLMTVADVAEYLQVSTKTVHRLVRRRELRSYRIGSTGPYRFNRQDVARFLTKSTAPTGHGLAEFIARTTRGTDGNN